MKSPGQAAFQMHHILCGFPKRRVGIMWEKADGFIKKMYNQIAQAAIDAQPCQHPFQDVHPVKSVDTDGQSHWGIKCHKCGKDL